MIALRIVVKPLYVRGNEPIKTYIPFSLRPQIVSGWIKPAKL
jgi:hypothetical protein